MVSPFPRYIAAAAALAAISGLLLQFVLLIGQFADQGQSAGEAIWRFFGFFTILTNCAVALVASAMAIRPEQALASARTRFATATAIALVGIVYSIALRHIWEPEGAQALADHLLHDASPLLFFLAWLAFPHEGLAWRAAGWALLAPLAYCAYAFARGAFDGWYAYYFLDPSALETGALAANMGLLLGGFLAAGLLLVAIDRWLARRRR